jgi:8-oxo-dGTP diphosphatase
MTDLRAYPDRPFLAVSAAIIRDGKVMIVRRAAGLATGIYTLPGGVVEAGESLTEAVIREVAEETGLAIAPVAMAGYREMIARDEAGRVHRHFVIVSFAARWLSGEPVPQIAEVSEAVWRAPQELELLETTAGLQEIVADAIAKL